MVHHPAAARGGWSAELVDVVRRTGGLVAHRGGVVLVWVLAGETAAVLLLALGSWLNAARPFGAAASLIVMIVLVAVGTVLRLAGIVAAMRSVCDRMVTLPRLLTVRRALGDSPPPGLVDTSLATVVPFLVLYGAWGYIDVDLQRLGLDLLDRRETDLITPQLRWVFAGLGVLTFCLGLLVRRLVARSGKERGGARNVPLGFALGCDASYLFLSVWGISYLLQMLATKFRITAVGSHMYAFTRWVDEQPLLGRMLDAAGWVTDVAAKLGLPFLWLAVATIVFGHMLDLQVPVSGTWRRQVDLLSVPGEVRLLVRSLVDEPREKWLPLMRAIALLGRGNLLLPAFFVAGYYLVSAVTGWLVVGVTHLVGPVSLEAALLVSPLLEAAPRLLAWVVLVPLLAACVDVTLARLSGESAPMPAVGASQ